MNDEAARDGSIVSDHMALVYAGLDAAEIEILRRVRLTDRDDDRPWFNAFIESCKSE